MTTEAAAIVTTTTAVEVRNGYKYYGSKSNPKIVLNYLNMSVMHGSIYGLLGASGCGKTTLLSCIVGQKQLNSGEVRVLGMKPGLPGSGVPGSRIGYMPQEIALVEEMTVKEIIIYFGRICRMTDEEIYVKYQNLRNLLELPPANRMIKNCSGGQQRRVSFACAMIHNPELLILDEPTVGLDPVLREKIWQFLVDSTSNSKLAVIITTHYIEEAKQADCIGLMRNGILLAEDSPERIMRRFEVNAIEDAFLILSQNQGPQDVITVSNCHYHNHNHTTGNACDNLDILNTSAVMPATPKDKVQLDFTNNSYKNKNNTEIDRGKHYWFATRARIKALMTKNFVQLFRQPSGIIFMLLFPLIDLACFYLAIGRTPHDLKIGIVNSEILDWNWCYQADAGSAFSYNDTCVFKYISCRYVHELGTSHHIKRIFYDNLEEAQHDAQYAKIVGYINFSHNFSDSMQKFLEDGIYAENAVIQNSQIAVHLDMTDRQVSLFLEHKMRDLYTNFIQQVLEDCNLPLSLVKTPINIQKPIYGSMDIEFQQYVAPGVIMTMVFFLAALMTAAVFISERLDGIWDRTLVAGVSTTEMLWAHLFTQLIIMFVQSVEVIIYVGVAFGSYNKGDTFLLILLLTLNSFCGMLFGLLISVYCKSHTEANFAATGAFYPMIILCGLLWPLEGMPQYLQNIVIYFPFTLPCISARNIIEKGWNLTHKDVYSGFLVMIAWIIIFFTLCIIGIKRRA